MNNMNYTMLSDVDVKETLLDTDHILGVDEYGDIVKTPKSTLGKVKTVNNIEPDENGNIVVETGGVKTINGVVPDEAGNISLVTGDTVIDFAAFDPEYILDDMSMYSVDLEANTTYSGLSVDEIYTLLKSGKKVEIKRELDNGNIIFYRPSGYAKFHLPSNNNYTHAIGFSAENMLIDWDSGVPWLNIDSTGIMNLVLTKYGYFERSLGIDGEF